MQQLQNEKVLEKKDKKATNKKELNPSEAIYCFKERKLCPRDPEEIGQLGDKLWEYAKNEDTVNFEDFCANEGISINMLYYWSTKNEHFKHQYARSKLKIGARIDKGLMFKQYEWRNRIVLHNYLDRAQKDDAREDERKIKLANEGVTSGETKIVVVNENKRYEGENEIPNDIKPQNESISQSQAERNNILNKIKTIKEYHVKTQGSIKGSGATKATALQNETERYQLELFKLLKSIGTQTAYEILKELCASGELPKYYLGGS